MIDFPGLVWCDDLRTHIAGGGHINSRWYVTDALPEEVKSWYRGRLDDHVERTDGEWVRELDERGVRLLHSVRIRPAHDPGDGPQPSRPLPAEAVTVVTDETALLPQR